MEHWYHIFSYFWWNDPVGIIASCIIIVLAVYLTLYLAVQITEFAYWISIQSVKGACLATTISLYSTVFVLLILPLDIISHERYVSDSFIIFGRNIEHMVGIFYPSEKKDQKTKNVKAAKCCNKNSAKENVKPTLPYQAPNVSQKTRRITNSNLENNSRQARYAGKNRELNVTTEIHRFNASNTPSNNPQYFCSKCGRPFTNIMHSLLKRKNETFCEICGQKYAIQDGVPAPIHS